MKSLLFLVHRIPYPPNKGDKIRSFNILKHLSGKYRVYLGAFIDADEDSKHEDYLRELCHEVCLVKISPHVRKLFSISALFRREAMSLPYYRNRRMENWVKTTIEDYSVEQVFVYSSQMAQYVRGVENGNMHRVVDFVDVDSEKWKQYSNRHKWPMSWLYAREGKLLLEYDRLVARDFDVSIFVTEEEAGLFRGLAPEESQRVTYVNNGVDTDFFTPDAEYENPYGHGDKVFVFTGAMDYWANVDAVDWFARHVFQKVRAQVQDAVFYIVGARPTDAVAKLAQLDGVYVTGAVHDIRPYLAHAVAAVAPLRIARGLQNKVLEAMAMAVPVIATPAAMDGIQAPECFSSLVSENAEKLSGICISAIVDPGVPDIGRQGRALVVDMYAWAEKLKKFEDLLE